MIKKRHDNQMNHAQKKGRVAIDEFLVKDRVVIQDNIDGKWKEEGTIIGTRKADDHSVQSYEIKMDSGTVKLRNIRFIKHFTREDDHADRHVQFQSPTGHGNRGRQGEHTALQREADSERGERTASPPLTRSKARAQ